MKWLLIDGFNLMFRAYYALPELTRADGSPTGALHGWNRLHRSLLTREKPDRTVVFFDLGGSERHLALHPEYKAQRAETPEALKLQIPSVKRLAALLGARVIEREGVEADDLVATMALRLRQSGEQAVIVSADKDFGQCVGGSVTQLAPSNQPKDPWVRLDAGAVEEKFGVPPERIPDYLALMGDAVDNIPGIPGVGPKTATKWLREHGSIAGILEAKESLVPERFRKTLADSAGLLKKNLELVTFRTDFPLGEAMQPGGEDFAALGSFYKEMGMQAALREHEKNGQGELFT